MLHQDSRMFEKLDDKSDCLIATRINLIRSKSSQEPRRTQTRENRSKIFIDILPKIQSLTLLVLYSNPNNDTWQIKRIV